MDGSVDGEEKEGKEGKEEKEEKEIRIQEIWLKDEEIQNR